MICEVECILNLLITIMTDNRLQKGTAYIVQNADDYGSYYGAIYLHDSASLHAKSKCLPIVQSNTIPSLLTSPCCCIPSLSQANSDGGWCKVWEEVCQCVCVCVCVFVFDLPLALGHYVSCVLFLCVGGHLGSNLFVSLDLDRHTAIWVRT